jgi:hypothetical protein
MKTKSLYFAALFVIGATVAAVGKDEPGTGLVVVSAKGSEVVKVIYKSENTGKVRLSVYDASSNVVFSETRISNEGFIRPLNFGGLQFGEYTVELTDASGTKSEKVNYQPSAKTKNVHVCQINKDGKFLLSVANNDSKVTGKIYDAYSNLVHESSQVVSGDLATIYSVKNFTGACTFEVTNNDGMTSVFTF